MLTRAKDAEMALSGSLRRHSNSVRLRRHFPRLPDVLAQRSHAHIRAPSSRRLRYCPGRETAHGKATLMQTLKVGDVTITSIIERDGPWRNPEDMFPAYDPAIGRQQA